MSDINGSNKELTEDEIVQKVQELRLLVLSDNVLKNFRTYDEYLLRFLYFKDFDINIAFKVMQEYTKLMIKYPKWYPSLGYLDNISADKTKPKAFINGRDRSGRRIYLVEAGKTDPSKSSPVEEACLDEVWFESVMDDPETQVKGISVIIDVEHTSWKMIQWLNPNNMKISAAKTELYPCKVLIYHIVGTSTLVSTAVKLAWPFIDERSKKNLIFHFDNWSSLHEHISPEVLPPKYGGTGPDVNYSELYSELIENKSTIAKKLAVDRKNADNV